MTVIDYEGAASHGIPRLSLKTSDVPAEQQFEFWHDLNQPGFHISPLSNHSPSLDASLDAWRTGAVTFSQTRFLPGKDRRYKIESRRPASETLVLSYFQKARLFGLLDDEPVRLQTGDIHIHPHSGRYDTVTGDLEQVTVYLPYDAVGVASANQIGQRRFQETSGLGKVIKNALDATLSQLSETTPETGRKLGNAFAGIVRAAIDGQWRCGEAQALLHQARSRALRTFVRENISDPDLNCRSVCAAFAASRATVYREFHADGGIGRYILVQRLHRALLELAKGPARRGQVGRVARACGFTDLSRFSNAFRSHYGAPPIDFLGEAAATGARTAEQAECTERNTVTGGIRLEDWLNSR